MLPCCSTHCVGVFITKSKFRHASSIVAAIFVPSKAKKLGKRQTKSRVIRTTLIPSALCREDRKAMKILLPATKLPFRRTRTWPVHSQTRNGRRPGIQFKFAWRILNEFNTAKRARCLRYWAKRVAVKVKALIELHSQGHEKGTELSYK